MADLSKLIPDDLVPFNRVAAQLDLTPAQLKRIWKREGGPDLLHVSTRDIRVSLKDVKHWIEGRWGRRREALAELAVDFVKDRSAARKRKAGKD